jgi:hypothetical protein
MRLDMSQLYARLIVSPIDRRTAGPPYEIRGDVAAFIATKRRQGLKGWTITSAPRRGRSAGRFSRGRRCVSERWARTRFTDLRYYGTPARGGHLAAYEAPSEFVTEMRAGLRALFSVSD